MKCDEGVAAEHSGKNGPAMESSSILELLPTYGQLGWAIAKANNELRLLRKLDRLVIEARQSLVPRGDGTTKKSRGDLPRLRTNGGAMEPTLLDLLPTFTQLNGLHARNREEGRLLRRLDKLVIEAIGLLRPESPVSLPSPTEGVPVGTSSEKPHEPCPDPRPTQEG